MLFHVYKISNKNHKLVILMVLVLSHQTLVILALKRSTIPEFSFTMAEANLESWRVFPSICESKVDDDANAGDEACA